MDLDFASGLPPRSEEGRSVYTDGISPQGPGHGGAGGVEPELSGGRPRASGGRVFRDGIAGA
eukprot:15159871-Alexandrium_andersonii.AAC.1